MRSLRLGLISKLLAVVLLFGPARAAASSSYGDPAYAAGFPAILKMPREDASYLIPAANDEKVIRINSNSFNAKKRSSFSFDGDSEQPTRGLTIVHFMTAHTYEFKSFDTHASEEEAAKFIACLKTLKNNKATYVILAHDSASKSMAGFTGELKKLGFPVLGNLKSRQAYVMNNFQGAIDEKSDDLSIQSNLPVPENITKTDNLFPRQKYVFAPSVDRYIAHAGGEVNGIKSTNSKDALDQNYKKGFRLFELDIIETSDGKFVAAHDWNMWSRFTDYGDELPVSHAEFMEHRIYGKYTTLDMEGINKWFAAHPEAILVTDKVNDPIRFANTFIDKKRLIMELFSPMAIEEAVTANITAMISQKPFNQIAGDKLAYLSANDIKHVAISRRTVARNAELLKKLQKQGIKVYVYHVNFDPGKDEKYVQENEIGLVYGMYADKWAFDPGDTGKNSR